MLLKNKLLRNEQALLQVSGTWKTCISVNENLQSLEVYEVPCFNPTVIPASSF